jgi:hypothetical protein
LSLVAALWLACLIPGQASAQECLPDPQLAYVCGLEKPEDLVVIPGTRWLVASSFTPGGGIRLVDGEARVARHWYTGAANQVDPQPGAYLPCPGPPDPELLHTRGLSLRPLGDDRWRLLVVNHGGREAIELFDVWLADGEPQITWRGCLPMLAGQVANSVTSFSDGTVLVTVLTRPGTTIGDFMLGRSTGAVWQWRPGEAGFTQLSGTQLPGNNGIETDPDQRHFYVVSFGLHAVAVFDRQDTSAPIDLITAPDFMPDNIRWTEGKLLLTGMRLDEPACGGLRQVINGAADPMLCHRGWVVGELLPGEGRIATVSYGHPQPGFNGHSVGVIWREELWLGSFQSDRLAIAAQWMRH